MISGNKLQYREASVREKMGRHFIHMQPPAWSYIFIWSYSLCGMCIVLSGRVQVCYKFIYMLVTTVIAASYRFECCITVAPSLA